MDKQQITRLVAMQKAYFSNGSTLPVQKRIYALKKLKAAILYYQSDIALALQKDLGKSNFESYMCEIGMTLSEIDYMLKHIHSYTKEQRVHTPLAQFAARSYRKPSPYGVVLIMSPWNYPFLLTIDPLVNAIAAGNTVVLKPSAYSVHTTSIIEKIITKCFSRRYIAVVTGGRAENTSLLEEHFDYIFFTGSPAIGKDVMRYASNHLTPITLELGGKSPCIVDKSANIKLAAKRIVFGKYLNCGQTCVAPDYIYCDATIKDALITEIRKQIHLQFGKEPLAHTNYGKIINDKHFHRLLGLIDSEKVVIGGNSIEDSLRIEPTVLDNVTFEDPIMQEEIFGPLLPILTYTSLNHAITKINSLPHPLALYLFTNNKKVVKKVTTSCGFGGGCINDTIIHLATSEMGFGGFGESGMGSYHGKEGFQTFTHYKNIVDKKTWIDLPMRYQPYTNFHNIIVHLFLK